MNLRKEARGRECMVRLPGYCNHDSTTVVLAHVRMPGITGVGQKAPDLLGAWACSDCHAAVDGRPGDDDIQHDFLRGVIRTQYALIQLEMVSW